MTAAAYLPFVVQALLAALITIGIIGASTFIGRCVRRQRQRLHPASAIQDTAYECGVEAQGVVHTRFSVKFFVTALLFMLFDLEVVILIPWTFIYREFLAAHIAILGPIVFFFFVLVLGLVYEIRKGALEWEK